MCARLLILVETMWQETLNESLGGNQMNRSNESELSDRSDESDLSEKSHHSPTALSPSGGYRKLRSFQVAELIYDGTVIFCDRFIDKRSRTHDQMVQAARSGRQNTAEGSMAAATSKKTEIKLTNVAKASLEELLLDYEDFLRQRRLRQWHKDSPEALAVRRRYQSDESATYDPYTIATVSPEVAANTLICLINQATYLLKRQIEAQERSFVEDGGFTERLYQARSEFKQGSPQAAQGPACPRCGKPMMRRTARQGPRAGQPFWGCSAYPDCTGTRQIAADKPAPSDAPSQ
jgi:four helix bundle suffix protein